eukprot:scaffold3267_cov140-Cylindrotheca_fusiformis.AAC.16
MPFKTSSCLGVWRSRQMPTNDMAMLHARRTQASSSKKAVLVLILLLVGNSSSSSKPGQPFAPYIL